MAPAPPIIVAASREEYRSFATLDPTLFADPSVLEIKVRGVFAAWIQQSPLAPADPSALLREVRVERYYWGRVQSDIAARTASWQEEAHGVSQDAPTSPPAEALDLWSTTAEELRRVSSHVCRCEPCGGGGLVSCPECAGSARVRCSNCEGTGKAYGYAKNGSRRLMNCRVCAGQLEFPCQSCQAGKLACSACRGSGRKLRWLQMFQTSRTEVRAAPDVPAFWLFPWMSQPAQATPDQVCFDARSVGEVVTQGALSSSQFANLVPPEWTNQHRQALEPMLQGNERVTRQIFSLFELPSICCTYALPGGPPTSVRFEGLRMYAPPVTRDDSFAKRARRLRVARGGLTGIALGIPLLYLLRGQYFQSLSVVLVLVCAVAVTFALYRLIRGLTLHGFVRSRRWAWSVVAGTIVLVASAVQAEPSLRNVRRLLSSGQLDAARSELVALGSPQEPANAELWNSLHLALATQSTDPEVIRSELTQIAPRTPQRSACARKLGELVNTRARDLLSTKQWQQAEALLASVATEMGELSGDPIIEQFRELRAAAQEQSYEACGTEVCRLNAARGAASHAANPARAERFSAARRNVFASLGFQPDSAEPVLARLKRLRAIEAVVSELGASVDDRELAARVLSATETVRNERARVPLIGADAAVLTELLGKAISQSAGILRFDDGTVTLYANRRGGRCVGIYIVGNRNEDRDLNAPGRSVTTSNLLSQSFGRNVVVPAMPSNPKGSNSSSQVGGVPVVARWSEGELMELRIGEARP